MKKSIITLALFFFVISIFSLQCSSQKKENSPKPKILTGWLTEDKLFAEFPGYKQEMQDYQPADSIIKQIDALNKDIHLLMILGTYCPDCKREVPRLLKIINSLHQTGIQYKMFGLNRANADKSGMREKYGIEYIPTFIFYENDNELGRIIETPMISLENDLLEILQAEK